MSLDDKTGHISNGSFCSCQEYSEKSHLLKIKDVREFIKKKVIDKIEKLREKYANELQKDWIDLIEEIKKEAGPKLVEKK